MEETIARASTGATWGWLRHLLNDPPILDRLAWREGVSPRTLISQDRGLMARTFGTLFLVGGIVGAVSLVVGDPGHRDDTVLLATTVVALIFGVVLFVVYSHTPIWVFQIAMAVGSLMIAAATAGGSAEAEGGYAVFYVWVVLLAFLFFPFPIAVGQTAFAAATYAVVLIARDSPFAFNYVLGLVAVSGTAGAVVGLLRSRVEGLAMNLATEANTDPVTAIANRRSFEARCDWELTQSDEAGTPLSLIICDLDRFKVVNDELGHDEGDAALRLTAETIVGAVRSIDAVARLGGEEFVVLLPRAGGLEAYAVAERIRNSIREAFTDFEVPLTVSCGVATRRPRGSNRKDVMRGADDALYTAKRAGRDRTAVHQGATPEMVQAE